MRSVGWLCCGGVAKRAGGGADRCAHSTVQSGRAGEEAAQREADWKASRPQTYSVRSLCTCYIASIHYPAYTLKVHYRHQNAHAHTHLAVSQRSSTLRPSNQYSSILHNLLRSDTRAAPPSAVGIEVAGARASSVVGALLLLPPSLCCCCSTRTPVR